MCITGKKHARYLVINADDFGYSQERNEGIVESFVNGPISSVSILINGDHVTNAVNLAKQHRIPLGLHLNLSEGRPVKTRRQYQTLVGEDGFFLGKMGFWEANRKNHLDTQEIQEEIQCQIDHFTAMTGQKPDHIDGHQHVNVCPGIRDVFAAKLKQNGIKATRLPYEAGIEKCVWIDDPRYEFYMEITKETEMTRKTYEDAGLWFADGFCGLSTTGQDMSVRRLTQRLSEIYTAVESLQHTSTSRTHTVCELMVHPGYPTRDTGGCGNGPDAFSQSLDRQHEMTTLQSKELDEFFKENDINITSFSECQS